MTTMTACCPACDHIKVLSATTEHGVIFYEALCSRCRAEAIRESQMDAFDVAYERDRANGWAD